MLPRKVILNMALLCYGILWMNWKRARIFKSKSARRFQRIPQIKRVRLPRVLLIIDEFQILFSESRQVAEAAEQLLSQLLKQGRSFGIHILLATQTLKGINAQSIGSIITQLGCRIALACGQEDSCNDPRGRELGSRRAA